MKMNSLITFQVEYLNKIFEPYSRETQAFRRVSGTGLGMPIVKSIVELLNGSIVVSSRLGQGTTFTVILPFPMVREEEPAPAPAGGGRFGRGFP